VTLYFFEDLLSSPPTMKMPGNARDRVGSCAGCFQYEKIQVVQILHRDLLRPWGLASEILIFRPSRPVETATGVYVRDPVRTLNISRTFSVAMAKCASTLNPTI